MTVTEPGGDRRLAGSRLAAAGLLVVDTVLTVGLAVAFAVVFAFTAGCAGQGELCRGDRKSKILTLAAAWQPVDAGSDPFVEHRPAAVDCPSFGYGPEGQFFEINTGSCNYATFAQPLKLQPGCDAELSFVFWHLALWGPDGATAHVAVQIGDTLVWQQNLSLPVFEKANEVRVRLSDVFDGGFFDPGEQVYFHVHNHGSNSYRIGELVAITAPSEQ
ncbi:MAG: hypothetical protein MJE77_05755 [Proteobacteria bacterium]|nr:hypothetical protein [Pseudomonadota bacterium]